MRRNLNIVEFFLVFVFLWIISLRVDAEPVVAEPDEVSLAEVSQGSLLFNRSTPGRYRLAVSQQTEVEMHISGPIVRARVMQTFNNPNNDWAEAIYAFPLPEDAAVDHLRMQVGERIIEGQIKERQQARRIYTKAKQQGRRSALVEQHRPNLFTTSVANIEPLGQVTVSIEYQQPLHWSKQGFSLRFPMAITPRYKPADADLPPTQRLESSTALDGGWAILPGEIPNSVPLPVQEEFNPQPDAGNRIRMSIQLDAGFPLAEVNSLYHAVDIENQGQGKRLINLSQVDNKMDRDFVLQWRPQQGSQPQAAFFSEKTDSGHYGLLMLMPPDFTSPEQQSQREIIFIIDTSGSMGGESIRQARSALQSAIRQLRGDEWFNVIQFNSNTQVLFDRPKQATEVNCRQALSYVGQLQAGGGTEMLPALQAAFGMNGTDAHRLQQIVFITDGAVGNEAQLLAYIHEQLQPSHGQRRLFTVGIGSAPNSHFMTEAAYFGRGTYSYINQPSEVQQNMEKLFDKLQHPVLTGLQLQSATGLDLLPDPLPDLYLGEPLVAIMKFDELPEQLQVQGRIANTEWHHSIKLHASENHPGLSVYWAREKIRYWMRSRLRGESAQKVREEVLKLALQHHLVSRYTSLVAVDVTPVREPQQNLRQHAVRGELPAGLQAAGQLHMARTATASQWYLLLGLLLMLAAVLMKITLADSGRRSA
ncbi:MAG: marine proteobacterial sortase target protein [Chromatiales bacterium]|jgi:Ca-activated chloride channel family protein